MKLKLDGIDLEIDGDVESVTVDGKKVKVKVKQPPTYYYSPYIHYPYYYLPTETPSKPFDITWTVTSSTTSTASPDCDVWYAANQVFEEHNL